MMMSRVEIANKVKTIKKCFELFFVLQCEMAVSHCETDKSHCETAVSQRKMN